MRNMPAHGGKSNRGLPEACCYVHFNADENEDLSSSLTSTYGYRFHHQQLQAPFRWNKSLASCERPMWDSHSVGYGLHETGIGFWFPQGDEISLPSKIQTGLGGQQASYLMDASHSSRRIGRGVRRATSGDKNPRSSAVPLWSLTSSWCIS
jgi:hypothetical protein